MVAARVERARWVLGAAAAAVLLLAMQARADGATALPALGVPEPDRISVALAGTGSTATATITVVNPSDTDATIVARLAAQDDLVTAVTVHPDPTTIRAHDATRVTLMFTVVGATGGGVGSVVIGAEGFAPAAVPVTITAGGVGPIGPLPILVFALVAAMGLLGLRLWSLRGRYDPNGALGSVKWNFGTSWATNITTVGAILGTVIGAGLLPEQQRLLTAGDVVGLSVFFGTLAVLAGFVYTVASRPVVVDGEPARQGYVRPFLLAAGITVGAVLGELATLGLLLADAALQGSTVVVAIALLLLVAAAAFLVIRHVWSTIGWTLTHLVQPKTPPQTRAGPGEPAPAKPAASWALL